MSMRMFGVAAILMLMGCRGDKDCVLPNVVLLCAPCNGVGDTAKISTTAPIPLAVVNAYNLCFPGKPLQDSCFYGCETPHSECQ